MISDTCTMEGLAKSRLLLRYVNDDAVADMLLLTSRPIYNHGNAESRTRDLINEDWGSSS